MNARAYRSHVHDVVELLAAGAVHWLTITPRARRELLHWKRRARSVSDAVLREHAVHKLTDEALNPEAAAFFAVLAPRAGRRVLIRLIVAFQIVYDYLDAANEPSAAAPLRNGLQLHLALTHSIRPGAARTDYYAHHPHKLDGGYVETLRDTCHAILGSLPASATVEESLALAVTRCGEAQAHNHATAAEGHEQLIDWSERQAGGGGYQWWELAAAGISCLGIHALFAAAATPAMTQAEAWRVDEAYFPPVCAISALLDSLIDLPHDAGTTNHSFAGHYRTSEFAAERYTAIILVARERLDRLRHARRHRVLLAGIAGYYLSAPEASTSFAQPTTIGATGAAGPVIRPILAVMRVRRRIHRRHRRGAAPGEVGGWTILDKLEQKEFK